MTDEVGMGYDHPAAALEAHITRLESVVAMLSQLAIMNAKLHERSFDRKDAEAMSVKTDELKKLLRDI